MSALRRTADKEAPFFHLFVAVQMLVAAALSLHSFNGPVRADEIANRSPDASHPRAADVLPAAAAGSWVGDVVWWDGGRGTLHGSDVGLRFVPADGGDGWLHVRQEGNLYAFGQDDDVGIVLPDWRAPWLLSDEVLAALDVRVVASQTHVSGGEQARCFDLLGRDSAFTDGTDDDLWLAGVVCYSRDGVPLSADLHGVHDLEGQDDLIEWRFGYTLTNARHAVQPATLFAPPADVDWIAPG